MASAPLATPSAMKGMACLDCTLNRCLRIILQHKVTSHVTMMRRYEVRLPVLPRQLSGALATLEPDSSLEIPWHKGRAPRVPLAMVNVALEVLPRMRACERKGLGQGLFVSHHSSAHPQTHTHIDTERGRERETLTRTPSRSHNRVDLTANKSAPAFVLKLCKP